MTGQVTGQVTGQDKGFSKGDGSTQTSMENLEVVSNLNDDQAKLSLFPKEVEVDPSPLPDALLGMDSDPSPAPVTAPVTETQQAADTLKIGDSVRDSSGQITEVARTAGGGWLLKDGSHISRDELKADIYSKAEPITLDVIKVQEDAQLLIDYSELITDKQALLDLTGQWAEGHKREVWGLLPLELQQQFKAL